MCIRHLIAIDSPPDDHVPDNMTRGPACRRAGKGTLGNGRGRAGIPIGFARGTKRTPATRLPRPRLTKLPANSCLRTSPRAGLARRLSQ